MKKGYTLIEFLVVTIITLIFIAIIGSVFAGCCTKSTGSRKGTISKFSHKGIIFQTWEGELVMGGMVKSGESMSANVWEFSVRNDNPKKDEIVADINKSMELDCPVLLNYKQAITIPTQAGTQYDIVKVTILSNKNTKAEQ